MEPKKKSELLVDDLQTVVTSLRFWSRRGIQGFLSTGLAHDFVEAIKSEGFSITKACKGLMSLEYYGCSYENNISLLQALRIPALAPMDNQKGWNYFFDMISVLGSNSNYFEERHLTFSWKDRDAVRVAIGLESINKIYKQEYEVYTHKMPHDVYFRRTGHCAAWSKPEDGYRYAKLEEVPIRAIKELDLVVVHIDKYGWAKVGTTDEEIRHDGVAAHEFFHNNVFYVPLVKI